MKEDSNSPWQGDWQVRLNRKLTDKGYGCIEEFLADNPGTGYERLAKILDSDVAPMQIYGEQLRLASGSAESTRLAAKDCLVRMINEYIKKGWGKGRNFSSRLVTVYGAWSTAVAAHAQDVISVDTKLLAVFNALRASPPPLGWLPGSPDDKYIRRSFEKGWPDLGRNVDEAKTGSEKRSEKRDGSAL